MEETESGHSDFEEVALVSVHVYFFLIALSLSMYFFLSSQMLKSTALMLGAQLK